MSKEESASRIPVVKQPLTSKLVTLSQRVRAHFSNSPEQTAVFLGLLGGGNGNTNSSHLLKPSRAARPSSFQQPFPTRRTQDQSSRRDGGPPPSANTPLAPSLYGIDNELVRFVARSPSCRTSATPDPPPPPTPVENNNNKRYSFLSEGASTPTMPFQDLSRASKNSSDSSLVPSVRTLDINVSLNSKNSSFEGDDSLGILTPDQMDDFALHLADDLAKSPVASLLAHDELTLISLTESDNIVRSSSTKHDDSVIELQDMSNKNSLVENESFSKNIADSKRINRTPSVEELPLDVDNGVKPVPSSFVTSITSITSLDNGYQGDGEWSRPASRGPEQHSPTTSKPKPRVDPMTDSDFFTESDADPHDELLRGDRRAQVIDGTLYGAAPSSNNHPLCCVHQPQRFSPTFEEMDSSGIFSDLERKPEEPEIKCVSEEIEEFHLNSPEGSTRTVSSKSDQSLKKLSPTSISSRIKEQVKTITNLLAMEVEESPPVERIQETKKISIEQPASPAKSDQTKKHKMPKRNVVSKIKTMITSNTNSRKEAEEENRRTVKKGRWDAVMSKISTGSPEADKSKLREVKSRVFSGLGCTPSRPPTATMRPAQARGLGSAPSASTRSLRDIQSLKSLKARRCRTLRNSECSLPTPPAAGSQSPVSSRNSSISDISQTNKSPASTRSVKKRDSLRSGSPQNEVSSAKKPAVSSPPKTKTQGKAVLSPGDKSSSIRKSTGTRRTASSQQQQRSTPPTANGVVQNGCKIEKSGAASSVATGRCNSNTVAVKPLAAVTSQPNGGAVTVHHQTQQSLTTSSAPVDEHQQPAVCNGAKEATAKLNATIETIAHSSNATALGILRHASLGVDAFAVLLNHLVVNYDAFSTPKLKKELERLRNDNAQTKLELEQLSSSYRLLEEDLTNERIVSKEKDCLHTQELESVNKTTLLIQDQLKDMQLKHDEQCKEFVSIKEKYELETSRLENDAELVKVECAETVSRLQKEHTHLQAEHEALKEIQAAAELEQAASNKREAELEKRLAELQIAFDSLKGSRQLFMESLSASDRDSKNKKVENAKRRNDMKVNSKHTLGVKVSSTARSNELEAEVDSLRCVLELRCNELQELRRQSQVWQLDAEQLPNVNQALKAAKSQNEVLLQKLDSKEAAEKMLLKENETLNQALKQGLCKNKRLSLQNEELTYKLKESTRVVNTLAHMSVDQNTYHSPAMRNARKFHKNQSTPFKPYENELDESEDRGWSEVFSDSEYPTSPKIKGVVEKSDSVSWTLDMDEPAEMSVSRILRRASSLRHHQSERPIRTPSSKSVSYSTKEKEQVIFVKNGEEISFFDVDDGEDIEIEANLRPKSDEELEMLRRVENGGRTAPKDLAGEAMVSGGASDEDDMVLEDDESPASSPPPHPMDLS